MSTVENTTINIHHSIDGNQNYYSNSEVVMKNDKLPVNALQLGYSASATRKGSFVIADIRHSDDELDDSDSTLHLSLLADRTVAPEVEESAKMARTTSDNDISWASPPVVRDMVQSDSCSRFRIVKIESRDRWHRGRWTCHDFADPPEHAKAEQMIESDSTVNSTNRNEPSIYYIPGVQDALKSPFGIVYNTGGHPVLEANLLPSSPRYARGSHFFSNSLSASDSLYKNMLQSDETERLFSSQRISTVDQPEPVSHSAARRLFSNMFMPLKVSVSETLQHDTEDIKMNESFLSRQLSSGLLMPTDTAQRIADQTSPLDVMMSATLGSSSSDLDMRFAIAYNFLNHRCQWSHSEFSKIPRPCYEKSQD